MHQLYSEQHSPVSGLHCRLQLHRNQLPTDSLPGASQARLHGLQRQPTDLSSLSARILDGVQRTLHQLQHAQPAKPGSCFQGGKTAQMMIINIIYLFFLIKFEYNGPIKHSPFLRLFRYQYSGELRPRSDSWLHHGAKEGARNQRHLPRTARFPGLLRNHGWVSHWGISI